MKKNKFTKIVLAYCGGLSLAVLALYGILALMPAPEVSTATTEGIRKSMDSQVEKNTPADLATTKTDIKQNVTAENNSSTKADSKPESQYIAGTAIPVEGYMIPAPMRASMPLGPEIQSMNFGVSAVLSVSCSGLITGVGNNTITRFLSPANCENLTTAQDVITNASLSLDGSAPAACTVTVYTDAAGTMPMTAVMYTAADIAAGDVLYIAATTGTNTAPCGPLTMITVVIEDNTAPSITCPPNLTVNLCDLSDPGFINATSASFSAGVMETSTNTVFVGAGGAIDEACGVGEVEYMDTQAGTLCPAGITVTRNWRVADNGGNDATCMQTILVTDTEAPTVTGTASVTTVEGCTASDAPAAATDVAGIEAITGITDVSDNCSTDAQITVAVTATIAGNCPIVMTRTYTLTDQCGNTETVVHVINIDDTVPPMVSPTVSVTTVEGCTASDAPAAATNTADFATATGATVTDVCGVVSVTSTDAVAGMCPIVITRTYEFADACGNTATHVQTINVDDTIAPTVTAATSTMMIVGCDASDVPPAATNTIDFAAATGATVTDACGVTSTVTFSDVTIGTATCPTTVERTYTLADLCGNTATHVQTFTINDTFGPTLTSAATTTIEEGCTVADVSAPFTTTATFTAGLGVQVTDVCAAISVTSTDSNTGTCPIVVTRTYTFSDPCGNTSVFVHTINVDDTTPPTAMVTDMTISLAATPTSCTSTCGTQGMVQVSGMDLDNGSADNCAGTPTFMIDDGSGATNTLSFDCSDAGAGPMTVTVIVFDVCMNSSSATTTVTIEDTSAPTITCPGDAVVGTDATVISGSTATTFADGPDCGVDATITHPIPMDNCAVTAMTLTITNNLSGAVQTVTVAAADICAANTQTVTLTRDATDCNAQTWTFAYAIVDCSGNTASCSYDIVVVDNEAPSQPTNCPANATLPTLADNCFNTYAWQNPTPATDNCTLSSITVDARDANGNTITVKNSLGNPACTDVSNFDNVFNASAWSTVNSTGGNGTSDISGAPASVLINGSAVAMTATTSFCINVPFDGVIAFDASSDPMGGGASITGDEFGYSIDGSFTGVNTAGSTVPGSPITGSASAFVEGGQQFCFVQNSDGANFPFNTTVSSFSFTCADNMAFAVFPKGENTVTYTYTDCSMNTVTCEFTVTVEDMQAPIAKCVDPFTVQVNSVGNTNITVADVDAGSVDNCMIMTSTVSPSTFDCSMVGMTTDVTLEVTDMGGNTHSCTTQVTVDDAAPIQLNCPGDMTLDTDPMTCTTVMALPNPFSGGNCNPMTVTFTLDNGSTPTTGQLPATGTFALGQTKVTYTIVDDAGATATCIWTVDVVDTEDPTITCPGPITLASCADVIPTIAVTASDNCTAAPAISQTPGAGSDAGDVDGNATTVTVTATDDAGNSASCDVVVTIDDTTAPDAQCAVDYTISLDDAGNASIIDASDIDNGSSDDCAVASLALDVNLFDCTTVGANTVTLTVTDTGGNTASCTTSVTVVDATLPEAICQDITVAVATTSVTITAADVDAGSNDVCGVSSTTIDIDTFDCDDLGDNNVTLTVVDNNGNVNTCVSTVTVIDDIDPVVVCPGPITLASCNDVIPTIMVTATDNCTAAPAVTQSPSAGTDAGDLDGNATTVTVTATDESGNTDECTVVVTIDDTTAPIALCATDYTIDLDDAGNAEIADASSIDNGSSDDCLIASLAIDVNTFTCGNVGPNTVTLTVTDAGGNASTCTTSVTVVDATLPEAICQDITVAVATTSVTITAADVDAGSNDVCGVSSTTIDIDTFDCDDLGDNNVTLTVVDNNGNVNTCVSTVTVIDDIDPVVVCPGPITLASCDDVIPAIMVTATDNCTAAPAVAQFPTAGTDAGDVDGNATTVTVIATDESGNTDECTVVVTIVDTTAPIAQCADDIEIALDDSGFVEIFDASSIDNGSEDDCSEVDLVIDIAAFDCTEVGDNTVTLTVTDGAGNTSTCTTVVTILDTTLPEAICQDITVAVATTSVTIIAADVDAGSNDACGVSSTTIDIDTFDCDDLGDNNVTLTVVDNNGNVNTCVSTVTVIDDIDPVVVCPGPITLASCDDVIPTIAVTATDNCTAAPAITQSPAAGTDAGDLDGNATTVTVTATDESGNTDECTVVVTVDDTTAPIAQCVADFSVSLDDDGFVEIENASSIDNGSEDDCSEVDLAIDLSIFACGNVGPNTITLTVTDAGGNASTCTTIVTILDSTAPDANCQDLTVELDATGQATVTAAMIDAASTDACGVSSTAILDGSFGCDDLGDNNVELTVTDNNGNVSTCVATITVEDNIDPVIVCPGIVTTSVDAGTCGATVNGLTATISDNCSATIDSYELSGSTNDLVIFTGANASGTTFNVGTTTITYTGSDEAGNVVTCETFVIVNEDEAPVLTCPTNQTIAGDVNCEAILVDYTAGTATDNCDLTPAVSQSPAAGLTFTGSTTVTLTATDSAGNTATCSFDVTVEDETAPIALCLDITVELSDTAPASATIAVADVDNGSSDNCGTANLATTSSTTFDCSNVGNNIVVLVVSDAAGNTATCDANVLVEDVTSPTFTCPANGTTPGCDDVMPNLAALVNDASDNCGIASVTQSPEAGVDIFTSNGDVVVATIIVTDVNGNVAECNVTITAEDDSVDPAFNNCPTAMIMVGNDVDECNAKVNWSIPVAEDNCELDNVTQTAGPAPGSVVDVNAVVTIEYTATDVAGNTATCSFEVTVIDTQDPQFNDDILLPGDVTVECDAVPNLAEPVYTTADANDNCGVATVVGPVNVSTQGADANNCDFYNYTVTRTWTITDVNGNTTSHVQIITVQDTTDPEAVCQDFTVTLDDFGMGSITSADVDGGSSDNCAAAANLTFGVSPSTFSCDNLGDNTVTLTVTDPCGNDDTCEAIVTVVEGNVPCNPEYDFNGSDPCVCLNNSTTLDDGQFGELIQIFAPAGQTFTLTSVSGLFSTASPAPPAAPTPLAPGAAFTNGTMDNIDNDGDGAVDEADENVYYTLEARHIDGQGYSATAVGSVFTNFTISLTNKCYYPTPQFTNVPTELCLGTNFTVEVEDQFGGQGVATIFIDGVQTDVFDGAALGLGAHTIVAVFDAGDAGSVATVNGTNVVTLGATTPPYYLTDADAQADPGCESTIETIVNVVETPTQVACNDVVQISIDDQGVNCVVTVTPDMVLEGSYGCFDDYEVVLTYPQGTMVYPSGNQLDASHVGNTVAYSLQHPISGNSCWGSIVVEDKLAPAIECPADVTILCTEDPDATDFAGNLLTGEVTVLQECSAWNREYSDAYAQFDCAANSEFANIITRTFIVTDEHGNASECTQTIFQLRGEIADVVIPSDLDILCNDAQFADGDFSPATLEIRRPDQGATHFGWPEIANINITTDGTGDVCGIGITFEDEIVNICVGSYKIKRTWTVFDWCPANGGDPVEEEFVQYIKVVDVAPSIVISGGNQDPTTGYYILSANIPANGSHPVCSSQGPLPTATVDGECNNIENVTISTDEGDVDVTPLAGSNQTGLGFIPSPGLPLGGPYDITYTATDECGNISILTIQVVVEDDIAPVAVCDEITTVSVSSDGQVVVPAGVLDDGSHDNCCLDEFLIKRMGEPDSAFGPDETFTCADIPGPVMVVFRAVDCFDNANDCMVEVLVEDKITPQVVCPAPASITCDEYFDDYESALALGDFSVLDVFGDAIINDNCSPITTTDVQINIDQCGEGTIVRSWSVTDPSNNGPATCSQTIFVNHVSDWAVMFPDDKFVDCGVDVPDFGEPTLYFETCELLAVSHSDQVFTTVPDACYKIVRQWTVINWCTVGDEIDQEVVELSECDSNIDYNGNGINCALNAPIGNNGTIIGHGHRTFREDLVNPDGFITYEQVIKVNDTVDPVFDDCSIPDVCIFDDCTTDVLLPNPVDNVMDCSEDVTVTVESTTLPNGSGFGPYVNVAPGTYTVVYKATDNCGNWSVCETTVTVEDCKKPTPYCVDGLVIEIMNTDPAMVDVWASDFDAGSFDNCGVQCIAFEDTCPTPGNPTDQLVFTCANLGENIVQLWVQDIYGNWDFCETTVEIQDNMDHCGGGLFVNVDGTIETEAGAGVGQVEVGLNGTSNVMFTTLDNGAFSFTNLPLGGDYSVTPLKDINPTNGVSTFDLVLITKHVLGVQTLDSPYKMIAADANNSESVSTFDMVVLRKLILMIDDNFSNNTSWRFVDSSYNFPDATNPWSEPFPEVISFNNLDASVSDADFVGVKVGDVNGSAQANSLLGADDRNTVGELIFSVADAKVEAGEQYTVDFTAKDFEAAGYQFTLNFDNSVLDFVELVPAIAGEENFGFTLLEDGAITTSWNAENVRLEDGDVVFSLVFNANTSAQLSDLFSVSSQYTAAEAYNNDGELLDVNLEFNGKVAGATFELFQNVPNPFTDGTIIGFSLPESASARLTITDASGKVIKVIEGDYAKGYNEVSLERAELSTSGVLYYQLQSATNSATKKMIFLGTR